MRTFLVFSAVLLLFACGSPGNDNAANKSGQPEDAEMEKVEKKQPAAQPSKEVQKAKPQKEKSVFETYAYTAPYICPNHCKGSGSDKPGKCSVCGMELIKNPNP